MVRFLPALALLLLVGCSLTSPPRVQVVGARLGEVGPGDVQVIVDLDLSNDTDTPLELLEFGYDFGLDGRTAYRGRWSAEATLSPGGTKRLVVPAVVDRAALASAERWGVSGRVTYVTPGEIAEIFAELGILSPEAGFAGTGPATELAGP